MKYYKYLYYLVVILTVVSAGMGLFYTMGGNSYYVTNIYGEQVKIFGDGIYKHDTYFSAGINKGTDLVMLFMAVLFLIFTIFKDKKVYFKYLQVGVLTGIFYYSACLVFGVSFNVLFPVYTLLFSSSLFSLIFLLIILIKDSNVTKILLSKELKGTALFLFICGASVLVWIPYIAPAWLSGGPISTEGIYVNEPTFVLDYAIVLPMFIGCGIALLKKKSIGYIISPILLTFIIIIGIIVISQSIFQYSMGIDIPIPELFGLVISFVVLGLFAFFINIKLLKLLDS